MGRTIGLFGDTGTGKTTQAGAQAKAEFKATGRHTLLHAADYGGHGSIDPLVRLGVIKLNAYEDGADPWVWINSAVSTDPGDDIGLVIFDSGTSAAEKLLEAASKDAAKGIQIGTQPAFKFSVAKGTKDKLDLGVNTESHYMVIQNFMLEKIRKSTWLAVNRDVLWTFGLYRGEKDDGTQVLGPRLVGKAMTPFLPKEFNHFFRMNVIPVEGQGARHQLYLNAQPEMNGMGMSFSNARYPLDATTALPAIIEPASLPLALELIEKGQQEAGNALKEELGL
jgi:hypothetical protein